MGVAHKYQRPAPTLCPCCGGPLSDDPPMSYDNLHSIVTGTMARILGRLRAAEGGYVGLSDLADAVYGDDPDGGPEGANDAIRASIFRNRPTVEAAGWVIGNLPGRGYCLREGLGR